MSATARIYWFSCSSPPSLAPFCSGVNGRSLRSLPPLLWYRLGGLVDVRLSYGMIALIWLISVVVTVDVAGYFAGRMLGGPKFWPKVSPKKTWSGTLAGWVGAAGVGTLFVANTHAHWSLIWVSVLVALAAQMGDIAESALKRRMGVKDSAATIPGHGGLMDRFDGLLAASLMMLVLVHTAQMPQGL